MSAAIVRLFFTISSADNLGLFSLSATAAAWAYMLLTITVNQSMLGFTYTKYKLVNTIALRRWCC